MPYDKIKKILKLERQAGMSYVELIVVLSIFSLLSGIVIYNYGGFQARVDLKNLTSDIALKIVEAQDSSLSGKLSSQTPLVDPWKPSYGVYFSKVVNENKSFIYFADLDQGGDYDEGERISVITIPKNQFISDLKVFYGGPEGTAADDLAIVFKRPSSSAIITSIKTNLPDDIISYAQITVSSADTSTAFIKVYPSGRIQLR